MQGIVKWFDVKIGYGFLNSPDVEELKHPDGRLMDVFVHYTKIQMQGFKKVEQGELVSYELVWSPEGKPQAENIIRLNPSAE